MGLISDELYAVIHYVHFKIVLIFNLVMYSTFYESFLLYCMKYKLCVCLACHCEIENSVRFLQSAKESCNGSYTSVTTSQSQCYEDLRSIKHVRDYY